MSIKDDLLPVSVVVPTYNGEQFVDEAIRSVFAQSRLPSELIVVDDGSTDGTTWRVEEAALEAPLPVKLIRLSQNSGGPARPTNVGIQAARSPLIAVLDQDDVFLPQRIASQAAVLSAAPDVAYVFGYVDVKPDPNRPASVKLPEKQWRRLRKHMVLNGDLAACDGQLALRVLLKHGNCVGGFPGFTFRRDDWHALGGLDERLAAAADFDLLCRLCQRGRVAMVPEVQYLHRLHNSNLSRRRVLCHTDQIETLTKFTACRAWPAAERDVRQAIGKNLYRLASTLSTSGHDSVSRRLFTTSLLLGGLWPDNLVRAANYAIKAVRRKPSTRRAPIKSDELTRAAHFTTTVSGLYGHRWWRLFLGRPAPPTIGSQPASKPGATEERHAA